MVFAALLGAAVSSGVLAQGQPNAAGDGLWHDVAPASVMQVHERRIVPEQFRLLGLDRASLAARLANAPLESAQAVQSSPLRMSVPLPNGKFGTFRVVESPIMAPELAKKYPQIKTYLGQGIDDPSATLRFDVTPAGFHAQILSADGTVYVDPYQKDDADHYIAYAKAAYGRGDRAPMQCTIDADKDTQAAAEAAQMSPLPRTVSGGTLRKYRLALSATGEYTQYQGGTVGAALAAMVSTINRVDGIYERELSVRMVLVANTDQLIYTDPLTDNFSNSNGSALLGENQARADSVIGSANYDIGHIFSTGGGGIASLGSVCNATRKAQGVTGSSAPIADGYDVDYVAHEMGHQFGGPHTFNSTQGSCGGGNRSAGSAFETGSGLTIMAYAGICGSEDLQRNSEDYFHRGSLNSILTYISGGGSCFTSTPVATTPPTINPAIPATYTIPANTPLSLTGAATDAEDAAGLTYIWEEMDTGTSTSGGVQIVDNGTRPLTHGFDPITSPTRTVPSLRYVLGSANVVPVTDFLPGVDPLAVPTPPKFYTGEVMPSANRAAFKWRFTARDNHAGGGATADTLVTINVVATSGANTYGPFAVTSPNQVSTTWAAGSSQSVTWNVANTDLAPISTANVNILLSLDGGYTWPVTLASNVPNNGSATVTVPANTPASAQARVRVEAAGNPYITYFDVSDANFSITNGSNTAPTISVTGSVAARQGAPAASGAVATIADGQDAAGSLSVAVSGAPPELLVSVVNNAGVVNLTAQALCTLVAPTGSPTGNGSKPYPMLLTVTDSAGSVSTAQVVVNVSSNRQPTLGAYGDQITIQGATRTYTPAVAPGDPDGNYSAIGVIPTTLPGGGTVSIAADGTVTVTTVPGTTLGNYKIRPTTADTCGAARTSEFNLKVALPTPDLRIESKAVTSGNNLIEPNECNTATVTVGNIGGADATVVNSTLSTNTAGVTIAQATSPYPNIASNGNATNTTAYQISTTPSAVCYSDINFVQTVTYAGNPNPVSLPFTLKVGRPAATNYTFASTSGNTIPTSGGNTLLTGSQGDDVTPAVTLPSGFSFPLYGATVNSSTTIAASSNGNVQFNAATASNDWTNAPLPADGTGGDFGAFPNPGTTLFPYWRDLDTTPTAALTDLGIYTETIGTAPNRTFKIEWKAVHRSTTTRVNFAVLFYEGQPTFDFVYNNDPAVTGGSATIGSQNAITGSAYTQYSMNQAGVVPPGTKLSASLAPAVCVTGAGMCALPDIIFQNGFQ